MLQYRIKRIGGFGRIGEKRREDGAIKLSFRAQGSSRVRTRMDGGVSFIVDVVVCPLTPGGTPDPGVKSWLRAMYRVSPSNRATWETNTFLSDR